MDKRKTSRLAGFTLIELLVSALLSSIVVLATYSVYRFQMHSAKVQEKRLEAQEYARNVLDMMVREIRNAAYNPLNVTTTGTNCAGGSNGAPSVVTATATTFRFTYDFQGTTAGTPPDGNCNGPDEDIAYNYDTTVCTAGFGNITRNGSPLTECNVTSFSLTYYDINGATTTTLANIQRVLITLTVQSKNPDVEFSGQLTATVTSNADLRNRGI